MNAHRILMGTLCVVFVVATAASAKEGEKKAKGAEKPDPAARAAAYFKKVDTDGNGTVSLAEFTAMHEERMARMKEHMGDKWDPKRAAAMPTADVIFARMDTDNSGGLTLEEMKAAHERRGEHRRGEKGKHGPEARKDAKGKGACKAPAKAAPEAEAAVDAE